MLPIFISFPPVPPSSSAKIKTSTDFSVIALTLYRDTDLLALPYPQVTVIF